MMDGDDVLWYHFSFGIVSTRSKFYLELVTFHHGANYFRFASQRLAGCYYRSTKPIILYERRRCIVCIYTVPVCIIINTNESIGLDWIWIDTCPPTDGVYGVRTVPHSSVSVIFILYQLDVPTILGLHNREEHRPTNQLIYKAHAGEAAVNA